MHLTRLMKRLPILAIGLAILACQGQVPILSAPTATNTLTPFPTSIPLTDTPLPTITPTLRPSSTSQPTLTLAPSLTAIPTNTPTPGIIGVGFDSGPLRDDFSDPSSGWAVEDGDNWGFGYFDGGYRMYSNIPYAEVCSSRTRSHTDFILSVNVERLSGADNAYFGVSCRKTGTNYYTLGITPSNQYAIYKTTGGVPKRIAFGESAAIRAGNQSNHLVASCIGNTLTLTVNGVEVVSVVDIGPLFGTMVGLVLGTTSDSPVEVLFDNFDSFPVEGAPPVPTMTPTGTITPGTPTSTATP